MNIISNCCLVGDLCEVKKIQYFTPFVWNTILPADIKKLVYSYDDINFRNINLIKYKDTKFYGIRIDDKFDVYYIHYLYADHDGLKRDDYLKEVTGRNIEEYILSSYLRRLERLNTAEHPKFMFVTNRKQHAYMLGRDESIEEWQEIVNLLDKKEYPSLVFTQFENLKGADNVFIVKTDTDHPRTILERNINLVDKFISI